MMNPEPFGSGRLDKRRVAAAFNRAAATYAYHAVLQGAVVERLVERMDLFRIDPAVILDVGCGSGNGMRRLRRRYPRARVLGLDLALEMLRVARRGWRWLRARESYLCGDAESLPLATASVDLVFSSMVLQWCPSLEAACAEFRRVLRPEGLLLFSTLGPDTLTELRQSWAAVDRDTHVNDFLDMHDVGDALVRAGLSSPVMDMERLTLTYPDPYAVMRDLKAIGAHNVNIGRPAHMTGKARLRQVIGHYERLRRDGVIPATYEVVYGHAWAPRPGTRPQDGSTVATFPLSRLGGRRAR